MSSRLTKIAILVPLLGLLALVGRAEWAVRSGPVFTIPIEGYDPRDLLHGQYLQYRYRIRWHDVDTCDDTLRVDHEGILIQELAPQCCLCLRRSAADGYDPFVQQVPCDADRLGCDGLLRSASIMPPQRHFVPETEARALESALRTHEAAIELSIGPTGEPAVRELLLDRRPWRDVLE